ncbi:hypothetical protein Tco_0771490 [Tanacetum coccineum]|uniref:Uncharacterized protein n=1 Tax=Tanacetum coccineum TaxID=301880 RepID=A0ABQ4ZF81_9ASTR
MSFSRFFFLVTLIASSSSKSSSTKGDVLEGGGVSSNVTLNQLIRRIHQLDTTYRPFYSEQRIDLSSLPNNTAYSVKSIRHTGHQQTIRRAAEIEAGEDDDPDDIADIFKIEGNLFHYETPLDLEEPWLDNGIPYQLCDHICEPYRFTNGITKWPTCSSDIDGFCNGGKLPGMVWVRCMTYFQDHKWYDELADRKLKGKTLIHKAKVKESWGNATPCVMKFHAWLINSFGNFHELDYNVLVKLQECWWKINAHEVGPLTRLESYGQRPYVNFKTKKTHYPYLDINRIFDRNYDTSNAGNTQDNQVHEERMYDPNHEPSVYKISRFEMMKYSLSTDEEYIAI